MSNPQNQNELHWMVLVLLLKEIAHQKGITQQEIAERTGYLQSHIGRVFSLRYVPKMDTFLTIAKAVGVNFFFEDKEGTSNLVQAFEKAMDALGGRQNKLPKN